MVSYTYDAWGKLIKTNGDMATTLGVKNPYRYRSYRYDNETGLYYLKSRYYDPQIGRFINADDSGMLNASMNILGTNLFSYSGSITKPVGFSRVDMEPLSTWFRQPCRYAA